MSKRDDISVMKAELNNQKMDVRKAVSYKNEHSTLFDYVMLYMKIWRSSC